MAEPLSKRYHELKEILEERLAAIVAEVKGKKDQLSQRGVSSSEIVEKASTDHLEETEIELVRLKADTANKIEAALKRFETGTYGYCSNCGEEIGETRLRALPLAVRCIDCEEAREDKAQKKLLRK